MLFITNIVNILQKIIIKNKISFIIGFINFRPKLIIIYLKLYFFNYNNFK